MDEAVAFTPITVGTRVVKNRIAMTSHGAFADYADPGDDGSQYLSYITRRAEGGCGLIVLQNLRVHRSTDPVPLRDDRSVVQRKLSRIVEAIEPYNTMLVLQLLHHGSNGLSDSRGDHHPLWSFNGAPSPEGEVSHMMTSDQVEELAASFAESARLAVASGVHGVELHGTHGYLIQQSMSPWGNGRADKWGEPLAFVTRVVELVRAAVGPEAAIGLRLSIDDWRRVEDGGWGLDGSIALIERLTSTVRVDYVNQSEGSSKLHYPSAIGTYRHPEGEFLPLTRRLRAAVPANIPVLGVGKILTMATAERALSEGICDLVGMTRAHIADPDIVNKTMQRNVQAIRPCVGANTCIDRVVVGHQVRCWHNPRVGFEHLADPVPRMQKVVAVVGGGPAGIRAAQVAAERGHDVTLFESSDRLGGRLNLIEGWAGVDKLLAGTRFILGDPDFAKVKVVLGCRADEETLRQLAPDAVVVATGATGADAIGCPSDGSIPVVSVDTAALALRTDPAQLNGKRVLIADVMGSFDTGLLAEALGAAGVDVVYVTPHASVGARMGLTQQTELRTRLIALNVPVLAGRSLSRISGGMVTVVETAALTEQEFAMDLIVSGTPPTPAIEVEAMAKRVCPDVILVGDAVAPRSAFLAFLEGDRAARTI